MKLLLGYVGSLASLEFMSAIFFLLGSFPPYNQARCIDAPGHGCPKHQEIKPSTLTPTKEAAASGFTTSSRERYCHNVNMSSSMPRHVPAKFALYRETVQTVRQPLRSALTTCWCALAAI